jgi:hypothetical protein
MAIPATQRASRKRTCVPAPGGMVEYPVRTSWLDQPEILSNAIGYVYLSRGSRRTRVEFSLDELSMTYGRSH